MMLRCEERVEHAGILATGGGSTIETDARILPLRQTPKKVKRKKVKRLFGTSRKENAMTYISDVFVIHRTSGRSDAQTDAGFELIVKGPGYEGRAAFEDLDYDEREKKELTCTGSYSRSHSTGIQEIRIGLFRSG
jgi:hypothetical protein